MWALKKKNIELSPQQTELVIKISHTSGPEGFTSEFCWTFKEDLTPIFLKVTPQLLQKKRKSEKGILPNSFYKKDQYYLDTKTQKRTLPENYRLISLKNIGTKILNKILANQIQQHMKTITYHYQVRFIPEMQWWFNQHKISVTYHINRTTWSS